MKSVKSMLAGAFALVCITGTAASALTYDVDFDFGTTMNLSGTIDTDGTEGYLKNDNITAWDLTWTIQGKSVSFDEQSSKLSQTVYTIFKDTQKIPYEQGFFATSTELSFDFTADYGLIYFYDIDPDTKQVYFSLAFQNKQNVCYLPNNICATFSYLGKDQWGNPKTYYLFENTEWVNAGSQTIGTVSAVPLPATLPLMLVGLAGLGWFGRRRTSRHDQDLAGQAA